MIRFGNGLLGVQKRSVLDWLKDQMNGLELSMNL
jgi:hypothetical protein